VIRNIDYEKYETKEDYISFVSENDERNYYIFNKSYLGSPNATSIRN
jgi:hypothetical protein